MRRFGACAVVVVLAAGVAGCDDASPRARPLPDAAGKGDDATGSDALEPNACEAQRVLHFVNRVDGSALYDAGLDAETTDAILEHRRGIDLRDGTRDDDPLASVDELEDLTGPDALALVLEAAEEQLDWNCTPPLFAGDTLRIVAANLTSGRYQKYDDGHGSRILEALRADIVLLQEVRYEDGTKPAMDAWVWDMLGDEFHLVCGTQSLPNGIASRYPIVEWGEWADDAVDDREFVWARIDIPGDRDLWAVSVHLLTKSESVRASEADALLDHLQQVPEDDYLVIGGDFNTRDHDEDALDLLGARVVTDGPYPADAAGNTMTNSTRRYPYDFVFVDPALARLAAVTRQGTSTFPLGLVVDTRTYEPIGDLAPALRDDSGAEQMQHMAVVRDFAVP